MGHTGTSAGLMPNDDQVSAVKNYATPQTVKELQLASYYRCFVKQLTKNVHPLHALTCKGVEFVWTEECQMV